LHRPVRRRRGNRPPLIARPTDPASAEAPPAPDGSEPSEAVAGAAAPANSGPRLGPDGQPLPPRPRRRRRRRPAQFGGAGENGTAAGEAQPQAAGEPQGEPGSRPPRRARRPRRPAGVAGTAAPRDPQHATSPGPRPEGQRERGPRRQPGERGERREGRGDRRDGRRDGRGRGPGRGRDDRAPRVERKLYSFDSVVDRGFNDVEEDGGETRRVHWTIVKRTVADQVSRKAMSQTYVLQQDGNDSDFATLGAARDAVNKTIVHPEKLTLSKAEHVAQKGNR
jgi:hypothetical protein